MEKTTQTKALTRAEKMRVAKEIIKGLLQKNGYKASELIEVAAKEFANRFVGEETENANDVRGRIGSVLDVMKKDNEVIFENGAYAKMDEEKPKAKRTRKKKTEQVEETQEEKPKAKRTKKKIEPLPTPPLQPIAPTAPTSPETAPEPVKEEKPKTKRTRAKKTEEKAEKVQEETKAVEKEEKEKEKEKEEKHALMDMSFLLNTGKKAETKVEVNAQEPKAENPTPAPKPAPVPQIKTVEEKKPTPQPTQSKVVKIVRTHKPKTADERLQEAFLARLHRLGGEYFEYYCVYLLEKYSRMNGRRLESLKITGGDHDGGIDGEIEVTDRLGFRETIYIQAKNWDPSKGDEKLWIVGETLLQQFIGACVCRQAKDKKQRCRGMFITTSRFTPEAKRLLADTSDNFVGYDGTDLYETAKECAFGIIKRGNEYVLDENLLSSSKAFFNMK